MRRSPKLKAMLVVAILALVPVSAISGDDPMDWQKAKIKNTATAYALYLDRHPSGQYASEAKGKAVRISQQASSAGKACDPDFPVMSFYAPDAGVQDEAIAQAISAATDCKFARSLGKDEKVVAADMFAETRRRLEAKASTPPFTRAVTDSGFIAIDLYLPILMQASDGINICKKGKSAWRDPTKQEITDCAQPYRELQSRLARQMADNMKADFLLVGEIENQDYRLEFWRRYQERCRDEFVQQIGAHYKVSKEARAAAEKETDPKIAKLIQKVALRLSGPGKPRSSRRLP